MDRDLELILKCHIAAAAAWRRLMEFRAEAAPPEDIDSWYEAWETCARTPSMVPSSA